MRLFQKVQQLKNLIDFAGADVLVAGSYVFGEDAPTTTVAELKAIVN